jgi:MFS family permease
MLVAVRLAMGMAEGPVPPLASALLLGASGDHRRGRNMGIYAFFAGLVGSVLAPIVLVGLANQFGWRATFLLAGLPGLALVLAIAFGVREIPQDSMATAAPGGARPTLGLLKIRNISLCAVIATLLMACMAVTLIFLPLYLVQVRRLSPLDMSLVMTAVGAATLATFLMLPALSDRLGRKSVVAGFAGLGAILPLGCFYWTGGVMGLAVICAFAAVPQALLPVSIGMIPGESVAPRDRGAALGLVMGAAEMVGGFVTPSLAGVLADRAGLGAALALAGGCAVAAAVLSLWLRETVPRLAANRNPLQTALEIP